MIRNTTVAGTFYPSKKLELEKTVTSYLEQIKKTSSNKKILKGLICPHAGYIYSGQTAAYAYSLLNQIPKKEYNVFIFGPAHTAMTTASVEKYKFFETPLGKVKVNQSICEELLKNEQLEFIPKQHQEEHSIEVQLPFLQKTLSKFQIIPIVLGNISPKYMAEILQPHFIKENSLFIISSDLSHFETYETANKTDKETIEIITSLAIEKENQIDACGKIGIQILLRLAKNNNYKIQLIDYTNSGDTAGDKNRVVGYGALSVTK